MKLYIVTGASRGLGRALAEALIDPDHRLVCLARSPLDDLAAMAAAHGCRMDALRADLGDPAAIAATAAGLEATLAALDPDGIELACLINNAGTVEPIQPAARLQAAAIHAAMTLNVTAPIALCAAFLRATAAWPGERRVLNLSSGAAHTAYAGWSVYGAGKAALDQFSRCVAVEQQALPHGARIVSLAPGVVDTAMQDAIRAATPEDFPSRSRFVELKETGKLTTPAAAAQRLLAYLARDDFGSQPVADVRKP